MDECGCGCCKELAAMMANPATDFDYKRACQCALYGEDERCDCHFCKSRNVVTQECIERHACLVIPTQGG